MRELRGWVGILGASFEGESMWLVNQLTALPRGCCPALPCRRILSGRSFLLPAPFLWLACTAAYLTSCTVWADTSGDAAQGTSEPTAKVTDGSFSFAAGTTPSGLGGLYIVPASEATSKVGGLG